MNASTRKSGIECLGDVRWGSHLCHFYETQQDHLEILVPFLQAGLEHNEFCLWVLSKGLDAAAARETLSSSIPDVENYLRLGQLEFAGYADWYLTNGSFDPKRASRNAGDKLSRTRAASYDGMRITGDAAWVGNHDWKAFQAFEEAANTSIGALPVIALCTYSLNALGLCEIIDVTKNHHGTIVRRDGRWEFIVNAVHRMACDYLSESEEKYRLLMQNSVDGIFIVDAEGGIIEANRRAEKLTGYSKAELEAKHIAHLYPSEYRETITNACKEGWKQGSSEFAEMPLRKKSGETIFVDLAGAVFANNGRKLGQAIVRDVTERRYMQDRLLESENYYRSVFEYTGTAKLILDADGTILHANSAFEKLTGYERSEIEGRMKGYDFVHPDDRDRVTQYHHLRRMDPQAAPRSYEFRVVDCYGAVKDALNTIGMIPGTNKSISSLLDVTDRKRNEETLKTQARVFESMAEGVVVIDMSGLIQLTNPAFDSMFGYEPGWLTGQHVSALNNISPEDNERFVKSICSTLKTNGSYSAEVKNRKKDGTQFFTLARVSTIELSGRKCIISVQQDITASKNESAALRESEERFQQLANCIQEVFWMFDVEKARLLYVSPAFLKIWGRTCRNIFEDYESFLESIVPGDRHIVADGFQQQRQGQPTVGEYRITRPDGSIRWIRSQGFPIFDEKGIPYRVAGISEDITDRKLADETLRIYYEHIVSLSSELMKTEDNERRRIATDLHDNIGQTLALAKINTESIVENAMSPSAVKAANDVLSLIDQSIRYTRSLTYELSVPILYELGLDAALEWLAEHMCEKHGLVAATEFQDRADGLPDEIRLLLYKSVRELLMNVVKHARTNAARVQVGRVDESIRIIVEDNGAGYSASENLLPGAHGGYGLFSVREQLKRAGGSLRVDSAPGRGTRAVIMMPYTPAAPGASSTLEA